jgi:uncharacterized protein
MQRTSYMIMFALIFALVIGSIHYYLWVRLVRDSALPAPWRQIATGVIVALATSIPVAMYFGRGVRFEVAQYISPGPYVWLGMMMLFFFLFVEVEIIKLIAYLFGKFSGSGPVIADPERRLMLKRVLAGGAVFLVGGAATAGVIKACGSAVIHRVEIALSRFPKRLKGLKIVQISDLHVGNTAGGKWLTGVVGQVNGLKPDVVAITGDLIDGFVENLEDEIAPLKDLRAPHGVYFVTGNHEYYFKAEQWIAAVEKLGIRVLRNERVEIGEGKDSFYLAGIDDYNSASMLPDHGSDLAGALKGADPQKEVILLAHQPRAIEMASEHKVGLVLAGHTHGGQIWPFTYMVRLQQPYNTGLHQHNDHTQIYINQGTGIWGPPMRIGSHNEITEIKLV